MISFGADADELRDSLCTPDALAELLDHGSATFAHFAARFPGTLCCAAPCVLCSACCVLQWGQPARFGTTVSQPPSALAEAGVGRGSKASRLTPRPAPPHPAPAAPPDTMRAKGYDQHWRSLVQVSMELLASQVYQLERQAVLARPGVLPQLAAALFPLSLAALRDIKPRSPAWAELWRGLALCLAQERLWDAAAATPGAAAAAAAARGQLVRVLRHGELPPPSQPPAGLPDKLDWVSLHLNTAAAACVGATGLLRPTGEQQQFQQLQDQPLAALERLIEQQQQQQQQQQQEYPWRVRPAPTASQQAGVAAVVHLLPPSAALLLTAHPLLGTAHPLTAADPLAIRCAFTAAVAAVMEALGHSAAGPLVLGAAQACRAAQFSAPPLPKIGARELAAAAEAEVRAYALGLRLRASLPLAPEHAHQLRNAAHSWGLASCLEAAARHELYYAPAAAAAAAAAGAASGPAAGSSRARPSLQAQLDFISAACKLVHAAAEPDGELTILPQHGLDVLDSLLYNCRSLVCLHLARPPRHVGQLPALEEADAR